MVAEVRVAERKADTVHRNGRDQEVHQEIDTAKDRDEHLVQINAKRVKRLTKVRTRKTRGRRARRLKKKTQFLKQRPKVKTQKTRH